jgi:hypothetical protein
VDEFLGGHVEAPALENWNALGYRSAPKLAAPSPGLACNSPFDDMNAASPDAMTFLPAFGCMTNHY